MSKLWLSKQTGRWIELRAKSWPIQASSGAGRHLPRLGMGGVGARDCPSHPPGQLGNVGILKDGIHSLHKAMRYILCIALAWRIPTQSCELKVDRKYL